MVVIERTYDFSKARVIVSFLQANGFEARLLDSEMSNMYPVTGGVRIAIFDDRAEEAERLLEEFENENTEPTHEPD